ncbi:MAG: DUF1257 domain-containing protein [Candidatus Caldarchaeum sp.]
MSHLRTCSIKLSSLKLDIAEKALLNIAEQLGLNPKIVKEVKDLTGRTQAVDIGLQTDKFNYGIRLNKGKVEVVGDDWGQSIKLRQFAKLFTREYTAIAVATAVKRLGFSVNTKREHNAVYIFGVRA